MTQSNTEQSQSHLETSICRAAYESVVKAIDSALTGYSSPMNELVKRVVVKHEAALTVAIDSAIGGIVKSPEFAQELENAMRAKVARTLIDRLGGEIEKQVNELKANPTTRARITLAIEQILKDRKAVQS